MNRPSRKQREIQEREERILEVASRMLGEAGYLGVTMERIAEAIEYSKGTVYQHFRNKEELLIALMMRRKDKLVSLFRRAAALDGNSRARMTAIGEAYTVFTRLYPVEFQHLPTLLSPSICDKATPDHCARLLGQDQECMGLVTAIVVDAVHRGELALPDGITPEGLVFGLWSTLYGSLTLMQTAIPFNDIGIPDPYLALRRNLQAMLDGVGWQPHSRAFDDQGVLEQIRHDIFAAEVAALNNTRQGRAAHG